MTRATSRTSALSRFLAASALLVSWPVFGADEVEVRHVAVGATQRMIVHSTTIPAPVASVWQALSTAEGWRTWAVPTAYMDELRPGAVIQTSYSLDAQRDDPANIRNTVRAYLPLELLVIAATNAPPDFPDRELLADLATVIELEPSTPETTLVRMSMVGYGTDAEYDRLFAFFTRGNGATLARLRERFESGPVEWSAQDTPGGE
jgi:uncharacterized protein YndB with AHSA1/START domain